ncbi:hypothetical protein [Gracilibacillus thailandensis]|nr:hypothetical protein [Gracilibacillus thailandensis]
MIYILRIAKNAFKTRDHYGRLLVIGGAALVVATLFFYVSKQ